MTRIHITLEGDPRDLRRFLQCGIYVADRTQSSMDACDELAGEVLQVAVKDGAAGITVDVKGIQITAPHRLPALPIVGILEDEQVHDYLTTEG